MPSGSDPEVHCHDEVIFFMHKLRKVYRVRFL
jgi:hypothetical protein